MKTNNHSENLSGLSREEITAYLKGDLSPEEMHRVESILESDDFAYEAMEGLEESESPIKQMESLSESYHNQYSNHWYKISTLKSILYPIGVLLIIGAYFFFSASDTDMKITSNTIQQNNTQVKQTIPSDPVDELIDEIEVVIKKPIKKESHKTLLKKKNTSITSDEVKIKMPKKKDLPKGVSTPSVRNEAIVYIKEIRYRKLILDNTEAPIKLLNRWDNPYEVFTVAGLDVVNLFYHNMFHNPDALIESLDPSIAHHDEYDPALEKEDSQQEFTYGNYIQSALELYKNKRYDESIAGLQIILEQYPKDVNAEFYIGLAYYRQNKSEKAIAYLDLAQNNGITYFHDDAKLYKALSYKKKDDIETCKILLQEIINQGGKNKKTAEEILNHL